MSTRHKPNAAPPVFELRSASVTLVVVALKTTDMAAIEAALVERFADTPGMFDHDPVVIDIAQAEGDPGAIDWQLLAALLWRFDMVAAAVRGGTPEQMAAAFAAGLGLAPEAATPSRPPPAAGVGALAVGSAVSAVSAVAAAATSAAPAAMAAALPPAPVAGTAVAPAAPLSAAPPSAADAADAPTDGAPAAVAPAPVASPAIAAAEAAAEPPAVAPTAVAATLIVDRPLRSGQQVYARGGDLVVLAAVNFGAEVIADGSIHVYAPLRGKAVAGAKGDRTARIFSTCMEPQLIAVAGTYRTTDSPLPANVIGKPAQIRLDGERLVFEPLG